MIHIGLIRKDVIVLLTELWGRYHFMNITNNIRPNIKPCEHVTHYHWNVSQSSMLPCHQEVAYVGQDIMPRICLAVSGMGQCRVPS